jgi:hypothetical protein
MSACYPHLQTCPRGGCSLHCRMKTALVLGVSSILVAIVLWRFIILRFIKLKRGRGIEAPVPILYGPLLLFLIVLVTWLLLRR